MQILNYCREFPKQSFDRGEVVLKEGGLTNHLYVMIDGWVEITREGVVLNKVNEKGAIFGEISALMGTPHMATVRAIEATRFHVISDAREFVRSNAEISFHLCTVLAQRLTCVTTSLASLKHSVDSLMKTEVQRKPTISPGLPNAKRQDAPRVLQCGVMDKEAQALSAVKW